MGVAVVAEGAGVALGFVDLVGRWQWVLEEGRLVIVLIHMFRTQPDTDGGNVDDSPHPARGCEPDVIDYDVWR
ncbi:hypothetical protein PR202_gb28661 [Eleusine coracana subsp. coracana]|uniref:Uncharacterized protein n=1 Tax=Eleusine coracana subsp. coracana TaxID=191504 RepID=A0AAV5FWY5_ELECO|nr:hypothetical protein PR202_gb28661 [Eleusine coracana subsp. coracana]